MNQDFTLTSQVKGEILLISTNGYINVDGGEKIAEEAYKYMDEGISIIVLDLAQSRIVNSIGISILIEIIEKLEELEGKLYFMNLTPTVEKTFKIMGLFGYATLVQSIDEIE